MIRGTLGISYSSIRHIKTLHTPVFCGDHDRTKDMLLDGVRLLDHIANASSYNKSILYTSKYNSKPQITSAQNQVRLQQVLREFLDRLQFEEVNSGVKAYDAKQKLVKIGLQLYLNCHDNNVMPIGTTLTRLLMEHYNKCPESETLDSIENSINIVRDSLKQNKLIIDEQGSINSLVEKMTNTTADFQTVIQALEAVQYKLVSDSTIRIMKGKKTVDEIEVSKGWRFPVGIFDTNEAYLRSIGLHQHKLIDIDSEMLVLVFDGTLKEANKILPTLNYASKMDRSLLLLVNGDCIGDALTSIIINNNKNARQGNKSRTYIIKYSAATNDNMSLQENDDLVKFLQLPEGMNSIYSPDFSTYVPSKICSEKYYGKLESLKATTGESFFYNSLKQGVQDLQNKCLQLTVTIHVGGNTEFEINQRRSHLDNLINNILYEGLSEGFVPAYGIALTKSIPSLSALKRDEHDPKVSSTIAACISAMAAPMEIAIKNAYGYNKFEVNDVVSKTILSGGFFNAVLDPESTKQRDLITVGILEPWKKIDKCLANVMSFIKLLTSCKYLVTQVFEKPPKRSS